MSENHSFARGIVLEAAVGRRRKSRCREKSGASGEKGERGGRAKNTHQEMSLTKLRKAIHVRRVHDVERE